MNRAGVALVSTLKLTPRYPALSLHVHCPAMQAALVGWTWHEKEPPQPLGTSLVPPVTDHVRAGSSGLHGGAGSVVVVVAVVVVLVAVVTVVVGAVEVVAVVVVVDVSDSAVVLVVEVLATVAGGVE